MEKLSAGDYAAWAGIIIALFAALLALGNFGQLFEPVSPETVRINQLYQFIYVSGSAVGAIFLGSLIWMSIKFRERG